MKDEKNSLQSEKQEGQQPNDSPKDKEKKKVDSGGLLTGLGCLAAIVIVGGLIWSEIYKWKKMTEIVGQAENGTFVGNHPTLTIVLCVVAGLVSTGFVIYLLTKDK